MTAPPPVQSPRKSHRAMFIAILIFLILGIAWFLYWWLHGRFYQYTDDAYVDGNMVMVTPRINGAIVSFSAIDGDFVEKGRVLIELDKEDARISLERSSAELGDAFRDVTALFENAKRDEAQIQIRKAEFIKASQDYEHRKAVVEEGGVSLEEFEHSQAALSASFFSLHAAEYQYSASVAQVVGTTLLTHPLVEKAKANLKDAYLFYQRCTIKAPVRGIVAQRSAEVGTSVKSGQPLMAIVPLDQLWVTANFKETQLYRMRVGQSVSVKSDTYGHHAIYKGTLVGIGGGTGSVFSILPPQNATGNWIKIVQRVPVRIALDQQLIQEYPLRLGLSMDVTIDTHDLDKPYIPHIQEDKPLFITDIFDFSENGVEELIEKIRLDSIAHE
jgi:membrane fusion protein (multidrug efflux system)